MNHALSEEEILVRLRSITDYNTRVVKYSGSTSKVEIKCPIHGWQQHYLNKTLCKNQSICKLCTHKPPEEKLKEIYGNNIVIDLSLVNPGNLYNSKIGLKCPVHGWQWKYYNDLITRKIPCSLCLKDRHIEDLKQKLISYITDYELDLSQIVSIKSGSKIGIKCPVHGWNYVSISSVLYKNNRYKKGKPYICEKCIKKEAIKKVTDNRTYYPKLKQDVLIKLKNIRANKWIVQAKKVHGDKFDYNKTHYTGIRSTVSIYCNKHKSYFDIPARDHIRFKHGGCPNCLKEAINMSDTDILNRLKIITDYNVKIIENKGSLSVISIECPIHGWQKHPLNKILYGQKFLCKYCGKPSTKIKKQSTFNDKWIKKAKKVHGDKFDYSSIRFVDSWTPVVIMCKKHKLQFQQLPQHHIIAKHCCPQCIKESRTTSKEDFIIKANEVHGNKYSYNNFKFLENKDSKRPDVIVTCPKHGNFIQAAHVHLSGYGCQKCAKQLSKPETELKLIIPDEYEIISNTRKVIPPKELDIYIPDKNLAIEYHGLRYHSEQYRKDDAKIYHLNKLEACQAKGIHLIQIFEDEYLLRPDVVKSKIGYYFSLHEKIAARKTKIVTVDNKTKKEFLNRYHLQGDDNSPVRLGLEYNDMLFAILTFAKPSLSGGDKSFEWSLSRYCTKSWISITGGFTKLLHYFIKTYNPNSIQTFADRRWSEGNIYGISGFKLIRTTKPNYWYVDLPNRKRIHRFNYRKDRLPYLLKKFDPNKTEIQNMHENGFYRIWDAGNLVYGWFKETL